MPGLLCGFGWGKGRWRKDVGLRGECRFGGIERIGGGKAKDTPKLCRLDSGDIPEIPTTLLLEKLATATKMNQDLQRSGCRRTIRRNVTM